MTKISDYLLTHPIIKDQYSKEVGTETKYNDKNVKYWIIMFQDKECSLKQRFGKNFLNRNIEQKPSFESRKN